MFNTVNTPPKREHEVFGDPLQLLWKNCIFDLCGVKRFYGEVFAAVITSTHEERLEWLRRVDETIYRLFPPAVHKDDE